MAAIAILVKGPFGGLMPLLTAITYAVASGRGRRLFRIDLVASLAVAVLPVAAWLGLLYGRFGEDVIARIFGEQLVERAVAGHDSHRGWWLYLVWAPLSLMPWLLLLPALRLPQILSPRSSVLSRSTGGDCRAPPFSLCPSWSRPSSFSTWSPRRTSSISRRSSRLRRPAGARLSSAGTGGTPPFDRLYLLLAACAVAAPVVILAAPTLLPTAAWTTLTHFVGPAR